MRITLSHAIPYKDTELESLELDMDSLTGNDLVDAEANLRRAYPDAPLWGTRHTAYIAAKSAHIPAEAIMRLPARDFMAVVVQVMSFFGNTGSEVSAPEITDD